MLETASGPFVIPAIYPPQFLLPCFPASPLPRFPASLLPRFPAYTSSTPGFGSIFSLALPTFCCTLPLISCALPFTC